ncbi:hypothetical protein BH23VER1_BH23VER1_09040 [soil metagenome]
MTELLKAQTNRGLKPSLHFLRDKQGHEIDALVETGPTELQAIEVKSGEPVASDFFAGLNYWRDNIPGRSLTPWLVHGGTTRQDREQATVLPWTDLSPLTDALATS